MAEPGSDLHQLFEQALVQRVFSGASLAVASPAGILCHGCWGRTSEGGSLIDEETRFDLASLTKPLVTASLCIWAVSCGVLDLQSRLWEHLPKALVPAGKRDITIRHLLNHSSGLPPYIPFYTFLMGLEPERRRESLVSAILEAPLENPPGTVCRYSDLGFLLLGLLLEDLLGAPLDVLATSRLSESIFSRDLHYRRFSMRTNPLEAVDKPLDPTLRYAATEYCPWRGRLLVGEVHDENAFSLGGVAGHAGLFGTARGIAGWLTLLWRLYKNESWSAEWNAGTVREFWDRSDSSPSGTWALGFDTPSPSGSSAGRFFSPHSVGHLGFTGTSFWLDLRKDLLVVILTNRVYPSRINEGIKTFRPLVHDAVMKGLHAA